MQEADDMEKPNDSHLETGWYFTDIADTDPMIPEDERERKLVEMLQTMTVEEIIEAQLVETRSEVTAIYSE